MEAEKPKEEEDAEMKPEGEGKKEGEEEEEKIVEKEDDKEDKKEGDDNIVENSTYEVKVGANNEHSVDVSQFFEDQNDKVDIKLLND